MSDIPMTPAEAVQLLDADKRQRVAAATEAVRAILLEYQCDIVAIPQIAPDGRIVALVQVVAK